VTDKFSHIAEDGSVRMVDVSSKPISKRGATADAVIGLRSETAVKIDSSELAKGTVLDDPDWSDPQSTNGRTDSGLSSSSRAPRASRVRELCGRNPD
jgi:hypothetical protein